MAPEEIVAQIRSKNRRILDERIDCESLTRAEVLSLMDAAAIQAFRLGSDAAMSTVNGMLLVNSLRANGAKARAGGQS